MQPTAPSRSARKGVHPPPEQQNFLNRPSPPQGCREGAATDTRGACAPLSKQTIAKIDAVAAAARELRRVRAEALPKLKGGLRALDTAVLTAKKDLLALWSRFGRLPQRLATSYSTGRAQLLALNQEVAAKIEKGSPVMPPGVPSNYPAAKKLVTGGLYPASVSGV